MVDILVVGWERESITMATLGRAMLHHIATTKMATTGIGLDRKLWHGILVGLYSESDGSDGCSLEEFTRMLHVRAQIFLAARASQHQHTSTNARASQLKAGKEP
jgi:hypothetical protein